MTNETLSKFKENNIDYDDAMERFAGNEDMYVRFLKKFPGDPSYPDLKKFLGEENVDEAFRAAHTLKGVVSNLAMKDFFTVAHEITEMLRSKKLDEAKNFFPKVEEAYDNMIALIATL